MVFFGFLSKRRLSSFHTTRLTRWLYLLVFLFFINLFTAASIAFAAELVMFEDPGCEWCQKWNDEIGYSYKETKIGQSVPLRRVMKNKPRPDDLKIITNIRYTPTFVVFHKGAEVGRIVGYPGEDFFWGYLENIIEKVDRHQSGQSSTQPKIVN